jgi:hypothetical protein
MLSYALGSLKIGKEESKEEDFLNNKTNKGFGVFGFIKSREISILKELEKYGQSSDKDTLRRLSKVLDTNNFNVKMLVAADYWFQNNDKPKIITPEMFTDSNFHFLKMKSISFGEKKNWDNDAITTLITYAKYLRDNFYKESDDIEVLNPPDEDELDFRIYENEDEYD